MVRPVLPLSVLLALLGVAACTCGHSDGPATVRGRFSELIGSGGQAQSGGEGGGERVDETSPAGGEAESPPVRDDVEQSPAAHLEPSNLRYQGAFRLPGEFNWGARGLSFRPGRGGGTLFVTGFELARTVNGEECQGGPGCLALFGEVRVPAPVASRSLDQLPEAQLLRPLAGFDGGRMRELNEFTWVSDIEYVPGQTPEQPARLYGSLNLWYAEGARGEQSFPTIWYSDLDGRNSQGLFYVGSEQGGNVFHGRKMGDYLFRVPRWYADRYLGGRVLVTGRSRGTPADGRESVTTRGGSQGPTLFAFHPVKGEGRSRVLDAIPILYYRTKFPACAGPNVGSGSACDFPGYTMCDLWTGAAFVEGPSGRAVILAGFKGQGPNCYDEPPVECHDPCSRDHGYHCQPYERQVIFYDADQLGRAAQGQGQPWTILPYHTWRPREFLLQGAVCGTLGGMTFDPATRRLFIVERGLGGEDDNATVVHVWTVN